MNRTKTLIKIDGYTRFCLTAITILLTVLIIGLWANSNWLEVSHTAKAAAATGGQNLQGIPNAGAQRIAILKAIQTTNDKLDKIINTLNSGKIRVVITKPQKDGKRADVKKP